MVGNPLATVSAMVVLGPMPELLAAVPPDLGLLTTEYSMQYPELWRTLQHLWPSQMLPPYILSEGWLWCWREERGAYIWEIVGIC